MALSDVKRLIVTTALATPLALKADKVALALVEEGLAAEIEARENEGFDRVAADELLGERMDAEIAARESLGVNTNARIDAEITAREALAASTTALDQALGERIGASEDDIVQLDASLAAEVSARESLGTSVNARLDAEIDAREDLAAVTTGIDQALGGRLDSAETDISQLEGGLNAEISARTSLDTNVNARIDAEIDAREELAELTTSIDQALGGRLDAVETQLPLKATAAQGAKADSAVQPNSPITVLAETTDSKIMTASERTKLAGVAAGAQVNAVTSVAGRTGAVALTKGDVGLPNADNTSDANKPVSTAQAAAFTAANLARQSGDAALDARLAPAEVMIGALASLVPQYPDRAGDARSLFSTSLIGDPTARPAGATGTVVATSEAGTVLRIIGADTNDQSGYAQIGPRVAMPIYDGRIYQVTYRLRRNSNPTDPSSNAIDLRWQNLNYNKNAVSNVRLGAPLEPVVADGAVMRQFLIGKAGASDSLDYVIPPTALYGVPGIWVYGNGQETDIISIAVEDVTDQILGGADVGALTDRVGAVEGELPSKADAIDLVAEAEIRADADDVIDAARIAGDAALDGRLASVEDTYRRTDGAGVAEDPIVKFSTSLGSVFAYLYANGISIPGVTINAPVLGNLVHPDAPAQSSLNPLGCARFLFDDQGALLPGGARWRGYGDGIQIFKRTGGVAFRTKSGEGAQIADWQFREITDAAFRVVNPLGCVIYSSALAIATPDASDITPLIGGELALVSDRRLALHVGSLFKVRSDEAPAIVTISNRNFAYARSATSGTIELDPARLGGQTDLIIRRKGSSAGITRILTARVKTVPVTGSPAFNAMFFGDSITNRQTAQKCNALLTGWGYIPTWVGTINGAGASSADDDTGPLGEGREGWAFSDFLGTKMDADWTSVVAAGGEATYQGQTKANKRLAHPFLNPDTGAGSAAPIVTVGGTNYRFDLSYYLTRFGLPTPGLFILNLGMNDMLEENEATSLAQVTSGYGYLVNEIRRVVPTAKILIWATTMPRGAYGDAYWPRWSGILAAVEQFVRARVSAGDSNIRLCSAWAHQSQEAGWLQTLGAVDATSGFTPYELTEPVHPLFSGRDQHSEPLAAAIANFF
jgi:hypothetical protein